MEKQLRVKHKHQPTQDEMLEIVIKTAQKAASEFGLEVGDIVCHPDDDYAYRIEEINGNSLTVVRPDPNGAKGSLIRRVLPKEGSFLLEDAIFGGAELGQQVELSSRTN